MGTTGPEQSTVHGWPSFRDEEGDDRVSVASGWRGSEHGGHSLGFQSSEWPGQPIPDQHSLRGRDIAMMRPRASAFGAMRFWMLPASNA